MIKKKIHRKRIDGQGEAKTDLLSKEWGLKKPRTEGCAE